MTAKRVEADPPGVFIKDELEARGWSQRDLAFVLGQTEQQLNPLLSGKRSISADMARLLGSAFDVDPQFFANLQSHFDISRAKEPDPAVRTRAELQARFPMRDMIRRGWIQDAEGSLLEMQVRHFFESGNDNGKEEGLAFAAKRTHYDTTPPAQLAWVYRVRQIARAIEAPVYSAEKLRARLPQLRALMIHEEAVSEAVAILHECGVRVVVVESLPGAKIDGVCTWIDDEKPVIGLSTLHDRLDNFWFVVRHEIDHILHGDGKNSVGMIDSLAESGDCVEDCEIRANREAAEFCVPGSKMDSFYARKHPYFSERDVIGFSAVIGVHPAIVVGQLQKRMGRYDYLRKYQVPVRKHLLSSTVADGWGIVASAGAVTEHG
jgi:HTH-type transcriptional regulator / antitoxin HigA